MKHHSFFFGIDVGGTYTKLALVDGKCRIVASRKISSAGFSDKSFFVKSLRRDADRILSSRGSSWKRVRSLGIGLPGPVDADRGVVMSLTNIEGWDNFHLVRSLRRIFPVPVFIENDANCMALAESRLGAARGVSSALCLTLGTGVGGGLIVDRRIYRGAFFLGGEVGHIPVSFKGPKCACGGEACLETYAGNRPILSRINKAYGREISLEELSRLARRGQAKAVKIWVDVGRHIGLALAGLVNVINPEVIVIGGGVSLAGDVLLGAIAKTVRKHAMRQLKDKVRIKKAQCGGEAGVLGAALLAKERAEKRS